MIRRWIWKKLQSSPSDTTSRSWFYSVRGRQNSDFDLAYLANQSLPLEREAELATDLAEICRGRIDLADIGRASPLLRFQIFRHGRALYEKEAGLFVERFLQAARIYEETLPLYKLKLARL